MALPSQRRFILGLTAFFLSSPALPTWGQEHDLTQLLSGTVYPLRVTLKDLNTDWRRVSIQGAVKVSDNVSVNVSGSTSGSTSQNNLIGSLTGSRIYLTKGQTASAAGRQYLIAYHLPGGALEIGALIQAMLTKSPPTNVVLTPDTSLPLSLLDLATIGSLEQVRVFEIEAELAESERAARSLGDLFKAQNGSGSAKTPAPADRDSGK